MDVKTLCLGVLSRGDASGYEIKKACEEGPFSHFQDASFGSIYPALAKLSAEKLVDCYQMSQEKRPDKKVYSITESGRTALFDALVVPPSPDKVNSDFYFMTFFAQLIPADFLRAILERRIAWYEGVVARMQDCELSIRPAGERFTHGLGLAHYRAEISYLKANMDQLLREIEAEQAENAPQTTSYLARTASA
ncbi:PadR family transcriptional regulator [Denitrobaculum tricleocarpae]|uniref:PadR family transcriptional regulator n=1 Tax=Denitrobaculum tricleocarpae TaxID=2591009 RepID=A0A545T1X7_9PROT|nr:PadR family transcriptional regulator [Denitrobaculum tricleocarpae]TQV71234.1 PadR family transcriptional regulator [Denitrobaculum tricleocarpae]